MTAPFETFFTIRQHDGVDMEFGAWQGAFGKRPKDGEPVTLTASEAGLMLMIQTVYARMQGKVPPA